MPKNFTQSRMSFMFHTCIGLHMVMVLMDLVCTNISNEMIGNFRTMLFINMESVLECKILL